MDSIRIKRLRSLSDTGNIEIKPITVLLGQNSNGKSTFLRVFPLLKQSVESRTTGPVLLFGRLVDFGNFEDAHQHGSDNTIAFIFKFKLYQGDSLYDDEYLNRVIFRQTRLLHDIDIELTLEITEGKEKEITRTSKLTLLLEDSEIKISFDSSKYVSEFYVNTLDVLGFNNRYIARNRFLLPDIHEEIEEKKDSEIDEIKPQRYRRITRAMISSSILGILLKQVKNKVHHATSNENIKIISSNFGVGNSEKILEDFKNPKYSMKSWQKSIQNWNIENQDFKYLRDLLIATHVPNLLRKCDEILANFSRSVSYMGPVRATAERYYRTRDLAVDEIDYQGRNLTIFLRNLTDSEMDNFAQWTQSNFGFMPSIQSGLGHISLRIQPRGSEKDLNIADTGFGFSQILPIITQLWFLSFALKRPSQARLRRYPQVPITYTIEQPELHLHPRLQGILTDVFVKSVEIAKENGIDLRLIIETHSETMVNRLGHLVAENRILSDSINLVLFEPSDIAGEVRVRTTKFDNEGYLSDWPIGFFEMEY